MTVQRNKLFPLKLKSSQIFFSNSHLPHIIPTSNEEIDLKDFLRFCLEMTSKAELFPHRVNPGKIDDIWIHKILYFSLNLNNIIKSNLVSLYLQRITEQLDHLRCDIMMSICSVFLYPKSWLFFITVSSWTLLSLLSLFYSALSSWVIFSPHSPNILLWFI